jgi:hypothetical protein
MTLADGHSTPEKFSWVECRGGQSTVALNVKATPTDNHHVKIHKIILSYGELMNVQYTVLYLYGICLGTRHVEMSTDRVGYIRIRFIFNGYYPDKRKSQRILSG